MSLPYFSIVIPTKNRSFLLHYAIQSVLAQSFSDLEVVIVDNDDTYQTKQVVDEFQDPRISYLRTGNLPMADNWEFGIQHARGQYITILEDKMALKFRALEKIFSLIEKEDPPVLTWKRDILDDRINPPILRYEGESRKPQKFATTEILNTFLSDRLHSMPFFPFGHISAVHKKLVERIVRFPPHRLCLPVNPDFTQAYLTLAYVEYVLCIYESLAVSGARSLSNGKSFVQKTELFRQFVNELGGDQVFYDMVPVKARTVSGSIYNDYVKIRAIVGGNLTNFPLDLSNYFIQVHKDILKAESFDVDMSSERKMWRKALQEQDVQIRGVVEDGVARIQATRPVSRKSAPSLFTKLKMKSKAMGFLKRLVRLFYLDKLKSFAQRKFARVKSQKEFEERPLPESKPYLTFPNVFEYIKWEHEQYLLSRSDPKG